MNHSDSNNSIASQSNSIPIESPMPSRSRIKSAPSFRLTERDFGLFKFLLDQKFGSLEALFFKFFDPRKSPSEPLPKNLAVARQRLGILKRAGLITTQKVYSESKSLYLLSKPGWKLLRDRYPDLVYAPPALTVDFRNYEHDLRVTLIRIALEKAGKAVKWYSERRIRMQGFKVKDVGGTLPDTVIPDGVFLTPKNERVALELEVSVRKKSRFRFKMDEYERVMRYSSLIHKVLFVAASDAVGKDLSEIIAHRRHFFLETYPHFQSHLYGNNETQEKELMTTDVDNQHAKDEDL